LRDALGLAFMIIGLLSVFIMLPVLSWSGINIIGYNDTPLDQMWGYGDDAVTWATVNASRKYPLLKNMRTGLIDPDTPKTERTRIGVNGDTLNLVFSDEFNDINRTFYAGDDPYWYAPDFWYGATRDLEWYDPDAVTTWDGALHLQLDAFGNHGLQFRSGMLNSWNQLCFKGGMMEVSVSLPGPAGIHALWPGVWSLGNLGRPGYLATTEGTWPYTYNECDAGITPNQSDSSGMNKLPGQKLANCVCPGEDHPTPGKGRGAPEIDVIEVSADYGGLGLGVATQSYQIAPFDTWWYPNADFMEIPDYTLSFLNTWTGGPFQQAVSTTTMLNNDWYDGKAYQRYAFEYVPGNTSESFIAWTVAGQEMMKFDARAIGPNGNIGQRIISEEPMSMILNLGISENWVAINWSAVSWPAIMRIDYVRIYQKEGEESVTCDPPGFETTEYIRKHPEAYNNPNYTTWADTGYEWPRNSLMHGC
ncbi:beta-glucan synthesis-associated, partial [Aureobasidium melanogenum]